MFPEHTREHMEPGFDHYKALQARDARFDGWFFVGVKTTGIYCRPVRSARTPQRRSCVFMDTAAAAEHAGFRPCLRCRPELAPAAHGTLPLEQALLSAIRTRAAGGESISQLAGTTGYSDRQLRRLTVRAFGVTPVEIMQTERLLFAKKLLQETRLPMMDVALSAGFGSLRRFNALFRERYRLAPTALRREQNTPKSSSRRATLRPPLETNDHLNLRLAYRPPLAWRELLSYLAKRVVPGVELIAPERGTYARTLTVASKTGWLQVSQPRFGHFLQVTVPAHLADALWPILARLRILFDLDADPLQVDAHLAADPLLASPVARHPGLRVPGAWDTFELAVRAVLGQQISVAGATTLAARLAARFGEPISTPFAPLCRLAPNSRVLAATNTADIAALGLTRARAQTLRDLALAAEQGLLNFRPAAGIAEAVRSLRQVRGIGEWTAQYIAMRALRFPDAFPAADLGLRKALSPQSSPPASEAELLTRAASWRPWRAYAAMHLWQSLDKTPQPTQTLITSQ